MARTQTRKESSTPQKNPNNARSNAGRGQTSQPQGGRQSNAQTQTGERDEHYNLVSVLYHALQGAETCVQYKQDAEQAGDEELAEFFDAVRERQVELAGEAKQLLASRIELEDGEDEDEDEEEDEESED